MCVNFKVNVLSHIDIKSSLEPVVLNSRFVYEFIFRYEEDVTDKKSDERLKISCKDVISQLYNNRLKYSTKLSALLVTWEVGIYCKIAVAKCPVNFYSIFLGALCFCFAAMLSQFEKEIGNLEIWALVPTIIFAVLLFAILVSVSCQPVSATKLTFSVSFLITTS